MKKDYNKVMKQLKKVVSEAKKIFPIIEKSKHAKKILDKIEQDIESKELLHEIEKESMKITLLKMKLNK